MLLSCRRGRRGVECDPAIFGEIDFYPGMSIAPADDVSLIQVIVFTAAKTVYHARRYPQGAQHNDHGTGKVLTVPFFTLKKEVSQRIGFHARQLQRVTNILPQVRLYGLGAAIIRSR